MIDYNLDMGRPELPLAAQVRDEVGSTLRSVRDTLAMSFQTLNLTLSSMNSTLRSMSASAAPYLGTQRDASYVPSSGGLNLGSMSGPMAASIANNSLYGLAMSPRPFNVSPMEWSYERQQEVNYRLANLGVSATYGAAGMAFGELAYRRFQPQIQNVANKIHPKLGKFMGTGMGRLAMSIPLYGAAGMAFDGLAQPFINETEEYMRDTANIRRLSTRFGSEFTQGQSAQAARGLSGLAMNELRYSTSYDTMIGREGYRNIMNQGLQMNLFQGRSPEEMTKQLEEASKVVKFLTGVLGSKDINETMSAIGQLKNMGVNAVQNPQMIQQMGLQSFKLGAASGIPGAQLMGQAMQHSYSVYGQYGMPSFGGVVPLMQNMALVNEMEKRRMLSPSEISVGGGHIGIAKNMAEMNAAMMRHPSVGQLMLASSMGANGQLDVNAFRGSQDLGIFGMMGKASSNLLGDPFQMARFLSNRTNMEAQAFENGGYDQMQNTLNRYIDMNPFMQKSGSYQDKLAMSMALRRQMASRMGVDMSDAAIKTASLQHLNPGMVGFLQNEGERALNRGLWFEEAARNNRLRPLGSAMEAMERLPEYLKMSVATPVGQAMGDMWRNIVGEPDQAPGMPAFGAGKLGMYSSGTYGGFAAMRGGASPNRFLSPNFDVDGYRLGVAKADSDYNSLGGVYNKFTTDYRASDALGGRRNAMNTAKMSVMGNYKDYYSYLNSKNFDFMDAFANSDSFGKRSYSDVVKDYQSWEEEQALSTGSFIGDAFMRTGVVGLLRNASPKNIQGGGARYVLEQDRKSGRLGDAMSAFASGGAYTRFANEFSSISGEIQGRLGADAGSFKDSLIQRLSEGDFKDLASRYGMTQQQFAFAANKQFGVSYTGDVYDAWGTNSDYYNGVMATGGALGKYSKNSQANDYFSRMSNYSGASQENVALAMARNMGLSPDMLLDQANNNPNSPKELQALAKLAADHAFGKDTRSSLRDIKDPALRKVAEGILMKSSSDAQKMFGTNSFGFASIGDYDEALSAGTSAIGLGITGLQNENLDRVFDDIYGLRGADNRDKLLDLYKSGDMGGFSDELLNSKTGSRITNELRGSLKSIKAIQKRAGGVLSDADKRRLAQITGLSQDKISSNAEQGINEALNAAIGGTTFRGEQDIKKQDASKKTLDTVIDEYQGKNVLRMIDVSSADYKKMANEASAKLTGQGVKGVTAPAPMLPSSTTTQQAGVGTPWYDNFLLSSSFIKGIFN